MEITWLGQAGLLFETEETKIMIDPYLSDSVRKYEPQNARRVPIDRSFFDVKPDIMIFTHNHLDHYDPETVPHFINTNTSVTVLAPKSVYDIAVKTGGKNEYLLFDVGTKIVSHGITFYAVKARHSDPYSIGVIIDDGDKKYYVTGDTLFDEDILDSLPNDIYAVFLPINGTGNNMNASEATRFCERIKPSVAVPVHFGMFDSIDSNDFEYLNRSIPRIYKKIEV